MTVGVCSIKLHLHGNNSLKGKRRILKSITDKTRNRFNVSIAEIDAHDKLQSIGLGVAVISNDRRYTNAVLNKIVDFIDGINLAKIVDYKIEIM
ncbi:MAG: DUF503 domain-containing protein [Nitrospinae bacterium]|nr:DUF503 domain-containing protein [Nitrospinota bacterium]